MSVPKIGEVYFIILYHFNTGYYVEGVYWKDDDFDIGHFRNGNCYLDKDLAEQVAMDMNLEAKLRQFTYENGWEDERLFNGIVTKWIKRFNTTINRWGVACTSDYIHTEKIYFKDKETVERAIEEIIKPFCKANPTYRFQEEE